jgi:uncharacterized protein (UPF0332 family)
MTGHMDKSRDALMSARLLFDAGHYSGAANRAYYAVFHAARTVVAQVGDIDLRRVRTHHGLRRLFELHIVKAGLIDQEIAAYFNTVESTRIAADYGDELVDAREVEATLGHAHAFLTACERLLKISGL